MTSKFLYLSLFAALIFSACATPDYTMNTEFRPPSRRADMATLVVVQRGGFIERTLTLDRVKYLGQTVRGTWFEAAVPAGKHELESVNLVDGTAGGCRTVQVNFKPGRIYFVVQRFISPNSYKAGESVGARANNVLLDLANEGDDGLVARPEDTGFHLRALKSREQVSMDPWAYLRAKQRLEPRVEAGQKALTGAFDKAEFAWSDLKRRIEEDPTLTEEQKKPWRTVPMCIPEDGEIIGPDDDLK